MANYQYITLREKPEYKQTAAAWLTASGAFPQRHTWNVWMPI